MSERFCPRCEKNRPEGSFTFFGSVCADCRQESARVRNRAHDLLLRKQLSRAGTHGMVRLGFDEAFAEDPELLQACLRDAGLVPLGDGRWVRPGTSPFPRASS